MTAHAADAALLALVRPRPAAPAPLDAAGWSALVRLVDRHGVPGLLRAGLRAAGVEPPQGAAAALASLHKRAIRDGLVVDRTCALVLGLLAEEGVRRVAPMKGAHVLPIAYGNIGPGGVGARRVNDLDLLVAAGERDAAHRALLRAGFTHVPKPPGRPASQRAAYERTYVRPGEATVDVHTSFADPARLPLDHGAVLDRATAADVGLRLAPDDALLSMAVHLGQDCFAGPLRGLVDVAWWVERADPDLERASRTAREGGAVTVLWLALLLASERLGARVPPELLRRLEPPRPRRAWLRLVYGASGAAPYRFLHEKRRAQALALYPLLDDTAARLRFTLRQASLRMQDLAERRGGGADPGGPFG